MLIYVAGSPARVELGVRGARAAHVVLDDTALRLVEGLVDCLPGYRLLRPASGRGVLRENTVVYDMPWLMRECKIIVGTQPPATLGAHVIVVPPGTRNVEPTLRQVLVLAKGVDEAGASRLVEEATARPGSLEMMARCRRPAGRWPWWRDAREGPSNSLAARLYGAAKMEPVD